MFRFIFFNITFERLFILTSVLAGLILLGNLIFWSLYLIRRRKNSKSSKLVIKSNFQTLKEKKHIKKKTLNRFLNVKYFVLLFTFLGTGLVIYACHAMFNTRPVLLLATPENQSTWTDLTKPITFEFDRPIDPKKINFKIVPEVEGEIKYIKSFDSLALTRKFEFYPKFNFEPNTRVYLLVGGFNSILGNHERYAHEANIETYNLPQVLDTQIAPATDVGLDANFAVELDLEPKEYIDIDFEFEPFLEFDKRQEGKKIIVTPKTNLLQSTKYKFKTIRSSKIIDLATKEEVSRTPTEVIKEIEFDTVKAPENKGFSPSGNAVFVDSEIRFEFNQSMQPESVQKNIILSPEFEYTSVWSDDNKILVLKKAQNLEFGKDYVITLKAGSMGKFNTVLQNDSIYKFRTIGPAKINRMTPSNGASGQAIATQIKVGFDQDIDKTSAQSKFSIIPDIKGSFSWDGNTMTFKPNEQLKYNTKYTFTIAAGVKSIKGQDTQSASSSSFTTLSQTVTLPVPLYSQKYRFSCNITAASMVLAYKGKNQSQDTIYGGLAKDSTPRDKSAGTWGDPDAGYVGQLDGPDGYGVNWGPIANYLNGQGVSASVQRGTSASALAKEIDAGNPSIIWAWNGVSGPTWEKWTTPSGKSVSGLIGMHSYVVIGYIGSSDAPTSMIINDPWGNKRTLSTDRFNYLWSFYGNTAVVVK